MSKIQIKLEELNALPAFKIAANANVERRFVQIYDDIHGTGYGKRAYEKEAFNFEKILREKPDLASCSKLSLFGCFLDMAVNGLSLDPTGKPHCYLIPRSEKTGEKDENGKDVYEKRAVLSVTGYGELVMRQRAGQIKYVDNPVIVYEGDTFAVSFDGKKKISYAAAIPRKSNRIIAAFIRIVRNNGSEDYQWMLEGDIERMKHYSERANRKWDKNSKKFVDGDANALYSSQSGGIDAGFLESKMIKHAFDAYPKVRIGKFSRFETEDVIDYGIEAGDVQEVKELSEGLDDGDEPEQPASDGVVIEPDDDDPEF